MTKSFCKINLSLRVLKKLKTGLHDIQSNTMLLNLHDIVKVNTPLLQGFDMGTLATELKDNQKNDLNVTKVKINWIKKNTIGKAFDFYKSLRETYDAIYHHVGIYSFRYETLKKFVSLTPSINELNHKLEQWRALDAKMTIGVSYVKDVPNSVDTKKDLINVENIIKNKL